MSCVGYVTNKERSHRDIKYYCCEQDNHWCSSLHEMIYSGNRDMIMNGFTSSMKRLNVKLSFLKTEG